MAKKTWNNILPIHTSFSKDAKGNYIKFPYNDVFLFRKSQEKRNLQSKNLFCNIST